MVIRPYREQDGDVLLRLFYDTVHTVNRADYTAEQAAAWAPVEMDAAAWRESFTSHMVLVAEESGEIVGFADMAESGYLDRLFVHRDWQRRGVAAALCDALEAACGGDVTTHASATAKGFFERRGYTVVRQQQVERRGVTLTNYVMRLLRRETGEHSHCG